MGNSIDQTKAFIDQTLKLLEHSDIRARPTEVRIVNTTSDNFYIVSSNKWATINAAKISENNILKTIIMFSIFDSYIDHVNSDHVGKNFKQKYKDLPYGTDNEIIQKEIYRILKLMRNTAVHSMSSINDSDDCVYFQNGNNQLDITNDGITLLYTYLLGMLQPQKQLSTTHHKCLNRKIYDQLKQEVLAFNDDPPENHPNDLMEISRCLRLERGVRYYVKNAIYSQKNDKIIINSIDLGNLREQKKDYLINID